MRVLLRRVATAAAATAASLGTLAGTAGPAAAAGCTTSFTTYSAVGAGTTGSKALAVECLLHQAGYTTSRNGSFSASDSTKLQDFQTRHALQPTGRTNGGTWAALIAQGSTPPLELGDEGSSVRRMQLALRALGRDELRGTPLRVYGDLTAAAVADLQATLGLPVTGTTSAAEWAALQAPAQAADGGIDGPAATKGAVALTFAEAQLGDRYKLGAAGPDRWDCSGLTMRAWAAAGVSLPHSSAGQYKIGMKIKRADLQPGDLVFFYSGPSHVGLYVGDGKVVHAPRPGKKVSYATIKDMPWKGARRPG